MKKILLFISLITGTIGAYAQLTCATAVPITANGTFTAPAITGTAVPNCFFDTITDGEDPIQGIWYAYTPASNGIAVVSSNLAANDNAPNSDDTRVSIYTGTCGNLVCYASNDDTEDNFLSTVLFPVAAGTTYYIQWDNFWLPNGFQFSVNLTPISCMQPLFVNDQTNTTTTSATVSWEAAIGNPSSYEVEYGDAGFIPEIGMGTVVTVNTNSLNITGLSLNADYEYYVRSNCSDTESSNWSGPVRFYAPSTMPYTNNFDDNEDPTDGFIFGEGWSVAPIPNLADSGSNLAISDVSTTGASDSYVYFKPISLQANEAVTLNFKSAFVGTVPDVATFSVTVGNSPTVDAQTNPIQSYTNNGMQPDAETFDYINRTATWTAPTTGIYYFAFHNTSPAAPTASISALLIDTITATSVLSVSDFLNGKFDIYPNPASSLISVINTENIPVSSVFLTDLNGRTVKQAKYNNISDIQINVSDLSAGMYMMTINSDRGTVTKKVIKN